MVLEATMICIDNSEWMRNGDYSPSRFQAQADAVNLICGAKTQSNPENTVGVLTMAGKGVRVLVTPTSDLGKILACMHGLEIGGEMNLAAGIQVAQLALKHRQNKKQQQRIIVFAGSPIKHDKKTLEMIGRKLKKSNVALDIVDFGEEEDGKAEKLEALLAAVNTNDTSHIVHVPPGPNALSDVLISTPIFTGDGEGGSGFAAAAAAAAAGGVSGFEFGVDPNLDPELALALRVSMEEERARQEAAAKKAAEEGSKQEKGGEQPSSSQDATMTESASVAASEADNKRNDLTDEENALLQQALAMSMDEPASSHELRDTDMSEAAADDPDLALALQLSVQDGTKDSGSQTDMSKLLADQSFVSSILASLPGVDPNDPSVKDLLASMQSQSENLLGTEMGKFESVLTWVFITSFVVGFGLCGTVDGGYVKYNTGGGVVQGKLNVHLVAHTHDDVGWLKTIDQYYVGSNNSIQGACVENVLDSVVESLLRDPNRKFVFVEMAFFQRWWLEQSEEIQEQVRKLVDAGQLEFINGGWCMHDEATCHYIDMIDQTTLGHHAIKQQFNKTPLAGWQIDPFGHSAVQAYLLGAELGFNSVHFARIDYQDRAKRKVDKSLEVIWRGSKTFGSSSQIFANAFPVHYSPPPGFNFEVSNDFVPVQNNPLLFDYNVEQRVNDFINAAITQANVTRTNHIMWTMGDDFQYQYAESWFKQMDKLIHYVNKDGRVNALYSTPSIYTDVKNAANESWPLKTDDYFPYADGENAYWTGFFTSRPGLKRYVRQLSGYYLAEATGSSALSCLVSNKSRDQCAATVLTFSQCQLLNISYCPPTEEAGDGKSLVIVAYNPLGWNRTEIVRIPVNDANLVVSDSSGKTIESQYVTMDNVTSNLRNFYLKAYLGLSSNQVPQYWLVFPVSVPPLGWSTYFIANAPGIGKRRNGLSVTGSPQNDTIEIGPGNLKMSFSSTTGQLKRIHNSKTGVDVPLQQSYLWYGSSSDPQQPSGAYIFRPNGAPPNIVARSVPLKVYRGSVVDEVHQQFNSWIYQVTRLYKDKEHAEIEYTIGPIPTEDSLGKEVITRMTANMVTDKVFYTDSNGRDFLKRATILDDLRGVGEALDESVCVENVCEGLTVRGNYYLCINQLGAGSVWRRTIGQEVYSPLLLAFTHEKEETWKASHLTKGTVMDSDYSLPSNVALITLQELDDGSVLLRLAHLYEEGEDANYSALAKVELKKMFTGKTIRELKEMSLSANQYKSEMKRMTWKVEGENGDQSSPVRGGPVDSSTFVVELGPMEIRTFLLKF
ncbi:hypothetical protein GH714_042286 [Hevea brasiliensis]|uniref:26S proteasome non-ATPase regulatory subunit 4 homolog n=3 Tax=Mesangiospermae TaxID=1437183 RepID=A0A6A6KTS5_HEVBR|nr:hypothetical protein GH714_042286 [Hevea brasiliensis]